VISLSRPTLLGAVMAVALPLILLPTPALAHGVQGRAETPIPLEMFIAIAAVVVVTSFIGLSFGWSKPKLTAYAWVRAPRWLEKITLSPAVLWALRTVVLAAFMIVLVAASFGSLLLGQNIAPLVVFVVWWIGLVPVSAIFGNIWREVNPWTTVARLLKMPATRPDRALPAWVGVWPAAFILLSFAWLELVFPTPAEPRLIAFLLIAYSVGTLLAMWRWGVDTWLTSGEAFSVYTGILALMSPVQVRGQAGDRQLGFRLPFVAAAGLKIGPGIVAVISVLIATVIYDGLSTSPFWRLRDVAASERLIDLGVTDFGAGVVIGTFGLLGSLAAFAIFYEVASWVSGRLARWPSTSVGRVAAAFAPSLVPIALAYFIAHYFTLFVFQSQDIVRLASDPLGLGWNLFGTVQNQINFQAFSPELIWIVQVVAIVVGHVLGLAYAHDRALELGRTRRESLLSQAPFLLLMVVLTVAGLWSLSVSMTG